MNQDVIVAVVGAVLGSGLIQFLITRHDQNKAKPIEQKIDKILEEQKKSEKDNLRTQLLVMMNLMSDNKEEIMTCAERYFDGLKKTIVALGNENKEMKADMDKINEIVKRWM